MLNCIWCNWLRQLSDGRDAYEILMGKSEGKKPLRRPRHTWVDNIRLDLREIGWEGVDWMHLTQDRGQWRASVNTLMNLRVPQKRGNSWLVVWLVASQEGLFSMELIMIVSGLCFLQFGRGDSRIWSPGEVGLRGPMWATEVLLFQRYRSEEEASSTEAAATHEKWAGKGGARVELRRQTAH